MSGFLVAALVAGFFYFILLRFAVKRITNRQDGWALLAFALFIDLVLLVSAVGLFGHFVQTDVVAQERSLSSLEELLTWDEPGPAVVQASIDPHMPVAAQDYVAYMEQGSDGFVWTPALDLILRDGLRINTMSGYDGSNWREGPYTIYLQAGDEVVIIGDPVKTRSMGGDKPEIGVELQASLVFRGTHEDFTRLAAPGLEREANAALLLAVLVLLASLILLPVFVYQLRKGWPTK